MLKIIPFFLLAAGLPAAALAQEFTPDIHVSYQDLDLHNAAGIEALDRRLTRAAGQACGDDRSIDPGVKSAVRHCRAAKLVEVRRSRDALLASLARKGEAVASSR
jgi:UrcA family protein